MIKNLLFLPLLCLAFTAQAQYSETFSTPNQGYLLNWENDFSQVNWTLTTWDLQPPVDFGCDVDDYFATNAAGQLECFDLDQEVCWLSPDLTAIVTGNIAFTADLVWGGFDAGQIMPLEYINVEYQLNGGAWVRHPNVLGADGDSLCTVRYDNALGNNNGSATTNFPAIAVTAGDALNLQICVSTNANAEFVRIDNINVSGTSKVLPLAAPDFQLKLQPNPFSEALNIAWEMPESGAVTLEIVDVQGKLVYSKKAGALSGAQAWIWQGVDTQGAKVAPGVYMLTLRGERWQKTQKLVRE